MRDGLAIHMYTMNRSMGDKTLVNSDGDFLFGMDTRSVEV
jgi:homogentisate 1,2-dioxygenase